MENIAGRDRSRGLSGVSSNRSNESNNPPVPDLDISSVDLEAYTSSESDGEIHCKPREVDPDWDQTIAWAMEAAAPSRVATLALDNSRHGAKLSQVNNEEICDDITGKNDKFDSDDDEDFNLYLCAAIEKGGLELRGRGRSGGVMHCGADKHESDTTEEFSIADFDGIPRPSVVVGEILETEITYCALLENMVKNLVPILKEKLHAGKIASPLLRMAALHQALLKAMTFTRTPDDIHDELYVVQRVISSLLILASPQFRKTYLEFARNSKEANRMIKWLNQAGGGLVSLRDSNIIRSGRSQKFREAATRLFRKDSFSGEDICKPMRHLSNLKESLNLLRESCVIHGVHHLDKIDKIRQSLEDVTEDDLWRAQDDLLQTNFLLEAEHQLRLHDIQIPQPLSKASLYSDEEESEIRVIVRDGIVYKTPSLLKRSVLIRLVLFNDLILWLNDENLEFDGLLVLSEDVRIASPNPFEFHLLAEDEKSSKTKSIRFHCKKESTTQIWMYHIQRVLRLRKSLQDQLQNITEDEESLLDRASKLDQSRGIGLKKTLSRSSVEIRLRKQSAIVMQSLRRSDRSNLSLSSNASSPNPMKVPRDLILLEKLGKGSFGEVYKAIDRDSKEEVAVKVMLVKNELNHAIIRREVEIHQQCKHPNIIKLRKCFGPDHHSRYWMVLSFCELGSLFSISRIMRATFTESEARYIAYNILKAIQYLHERGIIHRDISNPFFFFESFSPIWSIEGKNILIDKRGNVFLADFGVSIFSKDESDNPLEEEETKIVGTPHFLAPECIMHLALSAKSDIWSLGITMFEIVTGAPPHSNLPPLDAMQCISCGEVPISLDGKRYSKEFQDFVSKCLTRTFSERPSAAELLYHKWFEGFELDCGKDILSEVIEKCQRQIASLKDMQLARTKRYESSKGAVLVTKDDEDEVSPNGSPIPPKDTRKNFKVLKIPKIVEGKKSASDVSEDEKLLASELIISIESEMPQKRRMPWEDSLDE